MMIDVVKFNIGGQRYEVPRSLLDEHPDSMLTKIASEQWQVDPESEIFIDRNGFRFQYILDYMRDDTLVLPITECKETIIADLEYFGITVYQDSINDMAVNKVKSIKSIVDIINTLDCEIFTSLERHFAAKMAVDCIKMWCDRTMFVSNRPKEVTFNMGGRERSKLNSKDQLVYDNVHGFYEIQPDKQCIRASVNMHLSQIGLEIYRISPSVRCFTVRELNTSISVTNQNKSLVIRR